MREFNAGSTTREVIERRLGERGVHANAMHPGAIITELGRHLTADDLEMLSAAGPAQADSLEGYQSHALGPGQAERLWELSEQLVGHKLV